MGKNIVVIAFVSVFIGAIVVFFQRSEKLAEKAKMKLQAKEAVSEKHSRISVEEFVIYEYEDHHATGTFQGKLAQFQDPDTMEIFGSVRGNRLNGEHKEFVASEAATLRFASKGLSELVKDSKLQTVVLENQVRFGTDDITMFTDYAKYDHETGRLFSDRPVRIQNPQADMFGKKGFEYDSNSQDLKLFGPMEGTLVDVPKKP
jgi:hypothetical protein